MSEKGATAYSDPTATLGPPPDPVDHNVFVSEPFTIPSGRHAIAIHASAPVDNSWIGLDVALINDDTGQSEAVGVDVSYYHGYEGGESWSEGSKNGSALKK